MTVKFVDLFSGIGGIRLGFTQALDRYGLNYECVLSSEIDKHACKTYELNFHEIPQGDIRLISEVSPFDFLLAGFPCQPFSYAGKKQGFGDTRGTLFFEIERILQKYKPKALLLENVRGLTTHDGGKTFKTIISSLENIGYGVKYLILNSSNFGVPQNRVRLYIVGLYNQTPKMTITSDAGSADSHKFKSSSQLKQGSLLECNYKHKYNTSETVLETDVDSKYYCSDKFTNQLKMVIGDNLSKLDGYRLIDYRGGNSIHSWELGTKGQCSKSEIEFMNLLIQNRRKHIFGTHQDGKKLTLEQIKTFYKRSDMLEVINKLKTKGYLQEIDEKYNPVCGNMSFEVFKFIDPKSIAITLTSSDANRLGVVRNNRPRRLTPRECARLQGFPDTFVIHPSDDSAYKQFGNSVSVPVVQAVIEDFISSNPDIFTKSL